MNFKNIINGWKNLAKETFDVGEDYIIKQAEDRREICEECDLNSNWMCSPLKHEAHKYKADEIISGCGCPLKAKTAAEYEECPLGKWGTMFDKERFVNMVKVGENYSSLYYKSSLFLGSRVILHNNRKDSFNTDDGIETLSYRAIPLALEAQLIFSYSLWNAIDWVTYNKHAGIIEPSEDFIKELKELKENNKNLDPVVWIHPNFYPDRMSGVKVRTATDYLRDIVEEKTGLKIYYVFTNLDDIDYLVKILSNTPYFHEGSIVKLNEELSIKFDLCLSETLHQET